MNFSRFSLYIGFTLFYLVMPGIEVLPSEKKEELKNRLIREHYAIEKALMEYMRIVHEEYSKNPAKYRKYINEVFKNIRDRLLPHFEFEEKELFPLFKGYPFVEEFLREHKEFTNMIENAIKEQNMEKKLQLLDNLAKILKSHAEKENIKILPLLAHH